MPKIQKTQRQKTAANSDLKTDSLTHLFSMHPYGFLMFSGGRERVYWERMG